MNIWIFLFFFAIAAGLVVLFVVGTSCGVSQQITNEDACDPYAPKEKKPEVEPTLHLLRKLFKTPLQFRLARTSNYHTGQIAVTALLKGTFEELP